jgi:DNA recombination-dependent growth factor C
VPFLAASGGFTRYRLTDPVPDGLWAEIPKRLKDNAFRDIDATADERSFGWVSLDDWLDPEFAAAPPEKGQYLAFTLRLDTRRVSPAVFKKHLQIAVNEYLSGIDDPAKRFVSKGRKQELKEQVALRLRARSLPVPAVFDVVWNTASGVILLATTNAKIRSLFEDHFLATFELNLEPQTPFFLASRLLGEEAVSRLENLEPTNFAAGA